MRMKRAAGAEQAASLASSRVWRRGARRGGGRLGIALGVTLPVVLPPVVFLSVVFLSVVFLSVVCQPVAGAQTAALAGNGGSGAAPAAVAGAPAAPQDAPFITPSVDVDVLYELTSPTGDAVVKQRMRWQVGSLRQRLDPDGSDMFMITSWPDHTLTVVDPDRRTFSVMPAPSQGLTPPGQQAMVGTYARLGGSIVAGEHCIIWRTRDADGHASDVCYTADGLLLQVAQQGQITVRALSVSRVAQPDAVFAIPSGLKKVAPVKP